MNKRWLIACVLLLLGQAALLLVVRPVDRTGKPLDNLSLQEELLELSREIEAVYDLAGNSGTGAGDAVFRDSGAGGALQREQLLLELQDRESRLQEAGTDIRVSPELEAWVKTSRGLADKDDPGCLFYLDSVMDWVDGLAEGGFPDLERLRAEPDPASAFPSLVFEAGGRPVILGRLLLSLNRVQPHWLLREFDMSHDPLSGAWWIRGSFIFENPVH